MKNYKFIIISCIVVLFIVSSVIITVQSVKKAKELTKQLEYIYKNPKIEYREGPVRIVQGPTRIIEKIVIQRSSETITTDRIIDVSTTTVDISGTYYSSEPVIDKKVSSYKYVIGAGYLFADELYVIVGKEIKKDFFANISINYNWRRNDLTFGILFFLKF